MDINKLKEGIDLHKKNSPKTYNENIKLTVPIFVIYKLIYSNTTQILEESYNISNSELDVLASLVIGGGEEYTLSPTELYDRLVFSSGGMTKLLKKLEDKELIQRIENEKDKRSKLVKLSKKGKEMVDTALKAAVEYECGLFECLDKEEKKTFEKLLFKVLENNN